MGGEERGPAKRFAGVGVAQVHFDDGARQAGDGVAQGDGGVGEGSGVDHKGVVRAVVGREVGTQGALVVGLERAQLGSAKVRVKPRLQHRQLVLEAKGSVDLGLPGAELAQIDSVYDVNDHAAKVRSGQLGLTSAL